MKKACIKPGAGGEQMPMEEARKKELDFFRKNSHYADLKNVGTGFLANKLSNHLINAIRRQLPIIQQKVNDSVIDLERELESLGGPGITGRGGMVHTVLQLCRLVEETFARVRPSALQSPGTWSCVCWVLHVCCLVEEPFHKGQEFCDYIYFLGRVS